MEDQHRFQRRDDGSRSFVPRLLPQRSRLRSTRSSFLFAIFVCRSSNRNPAPHLENQFSKLYVALDRSSLRQFCDCCKLESQVMERSEGIGVLRRCDPRVRPRAQGAVSHRRGSVLARLHRVSPLSANSHDTPRVHVLGRYAAV